MLATCPRDCLLWGIQPDGTCVNGPCELHAEYARGCHAMIPDIKPALSFTVTLGVTAGYGPSDMVHYLSRDFGAIWQGAADAVYRGAGVYVSAVFHMSTVVYNQEWGCPRGGEHTVTYSGCQNPAFVTDESLYMLAVLDVVRRCKLLLNQVTALVVFSRADVVYLKDES